MAFAAASRHVLLDTTERFDAVLSIYTGPEDDPDGVGVQVVYDPSGLVPTITMASPDGMIELRGLAEIRAVNGAMRRGAEMAERHAP